MKRMILVCCGLSIAALASWGQSGVLVVRPQSGLDEWAKADQQVRRLAPSAFPGLPEVVRAELERRRCMVPQVWANKKAHNVIRGKFLGTGQEDWAVLCSVNRVSAILVFPSGAVTKVHEIAQEADVHKLQGVGNGEIGYSRAIAPVGRTVILSNSLGQPDPGRIDHVGIDDAFVEKASVVHYFRSGKWIQFCGAD
jgi:hypothetical protein